MFQFLFIVVLSLIPFRASAIEVGEVVSAIEAKYSDVHGMQGQFVQVVKSDFTGTEKTTGKVTFSRPTKMRWEFHGESAKQYITDGRVLWLYSPEEKTVYQYEDVSAAVGGAGNILSSLGNLDEDYLVSLVPGDLIGVRLTPRKEQRMKSLYLGFDKAYLLKVVRFDDALGSTTELKLSDLVLNPKTGADYFTFTPPDGVEVISVGGM